MKRTTESLKDELAVVYNNTYLLTKVVFTKVAAKITLTCTRHGDFKVRASDALKGSKCPKCGKRYWDTSSFISHSKQLHKDRYSYPHTEYISSKRNVIITCPIHGNFNQRPSTHADGKGCKKCAIEAVTKINTSNAEEFSLKAAHMHVGEYTYDNVVYVNNSTNVLITCRKHGDFAQKPSNHLSGAGCPHCTGSGFNGSKPGLVYYLSINNGEAYKIGITNRSVGERFNLKDLQKIQILKTWEMDGDACIAFEKEILSKYKDKKYVGPKLLKDGNTELFKEDVLNLKGNLMNSTKYTEGSGNA